MDTDNLKRDELASMKLRRLFQQRGFRRVRVGKFEEYSLYIENKNFLQSEHVITFTDMDGKQMALKPDMTLSVVKNISPEPLANFQKLYYLDEVFRVTREHRDFQALNQIGVEMIGPVDAFSCIEIIDLALESLEKISENYVLDLSHLGFLSGMLSYLGLSHRQERAVLAAIHAKSGHELSAVLAEAGTPQEDRDRVLALAELHGSLATALPKAKALIFNDEMQAAFEELWEVERALSHNGFAERLNLDFSVVNDLDYYNGITFLGYVEGIPQAVLTGGRYDHLLKKMKKSSGAIGFAVSLDQLTIHNRSGHIYDFDLLILYDAGCDWSALLQLVKQLNGEGKSVRLEKSTADLDGADFTFGEWRQFQGDKLTEKGGASTC